MDAQASIFVSEREEKKILALVTGLENVRRKKCTTIIREPYCLRNPKPGSGGKKTLRYSITKAINTQIPKSPKTFPKGIWLPSKKKKFP